MSVAISRCDAPAARAEAAAPARLQRSHGAAEIAFARSGMATQLAHLFQRTPCRILFPQPEPGDPALAVLLTTAGGLTGGDSITIEARVDAGGEATLTTQAAEKLYRSLGQETRIDIALAVGEDAYLEYLPQETILFDGARLRRSTHVVVASGGRLLASEILVFGRAAHDERLTRGYLYDSWQLRDGSGALLWRDALVLDGAIEAQLASPFSLAGAEALATAIYLGGDAPALLPFARKLAESGATRAGASVVHGVLIARFFGAPAAAVRSDVTRYLRSFRAVLGWPARLPRVWSV